MLERRASGAEHLVGGAPGGEIAGYGLFWADPVTGVGLVEPMMTGPGGDVFAIIWSAKDHKLIGLNASGRAGSLMTRETLIARGRTSSGGARSWEDLPAAARDYVSFVEREAGIPVGYVSVGPERSQIIVRDSAPLRVPASVR